MKNAYYVQSELNVSDDGDPTFTMQDNDDDSDSMWEDEEDKKEEKKPSSMAPIDNAQIFFGTLEGINTLLAEMNEVSSYPLRREKNFKKCAIKARRTKTIRWALLSTLTVLISVLLSKAKTATTITTTATTKKVIMAMTTAM